MSSQYDDPPHTLQPNLQPGAPSGQAKPEPSEIGGFPDGPAPPDPGPADQSTASPGKGQPDATQPVQDPAEAAPAMRPLAWCALCQKHVEPVGGGQCPTCRRFVRDNVVALKHGNRRRQPPTAVVARRTAIAEEMFKERGKREHVDVITRCRILEYATLSVQIEDVTNYLDEVGLQTVRGRTRTTPLKAVLELSARREHLAALLTGEAAAPPAHTSGEDLSGLSASDIADRAEALAKSLRAEINDESVLRPAVDED